jgi:hypothetical protein
VKQEHDRLLDTEKGNKQEEQRKQQQQIDNKSESL